MESAQIEPTSWLDRPILPAFPKLKIETVLVAVILILAVLSRFVNLGARVMSHDEVNHVVPAYSLYQGNGYAFDPITHGPLQFHMMALSFFLLGDSDFSARAPDALISVLTILFVLFAFRRYLGRTGALIAGFLYLISPFMMFYGRYTRNEVYGGLWTVLVLFGTLRYLESGSRKWLYLLTVTIALHFTDKATAYIYNAELLIFLGVLFLANVIRLKWPSAGRRWMFIFLTATALALILLVVIFAALYPGSTSTTDLGTGNLPNSILSVEKIAEVGAVGLALVGGLAAFIVLVRSFGWKTIRALRSFDLIMLTGVLTLPMLAPILETMAGVNPLDYTSQGMLTSAAFLVPLFIAAIAIGLWWKPRFYISAVVIFFAIFTVFYTTFFTNGKGFFMGLVALLGYWLQQQAVNRGGQPLYYFALIQIPIYEYLAALGTIAALILAYRHKLFAQFARFSPAHQPANPPEDDSTPEHEDSLAALFYRTPRQTGAAPEEGAAGEETPEGEMPDEDPPEENVPDEDPPGEIAPEKEEMAPPVAELQPEEAQSQLVAAAPAVEEAQVSYAPRIPVAALLAYWSAMSLVAFSLAGERMPWLTVHIAGGMLLASGWALGYLVETAPWRAIANRKGLVTLLLIPIIFASLAGTLGSLLGANPPFSGNTLPQLESTATFFTSLVALIASTFGFFRLLKDWQPQALWRLLVLGFFVLCAVLTARTAYTASFINYNDATEFMVYAHAAPGPKEVLSQLEDISQRLTQGKNLVVAYDNETLYPWWWYLRDWPNKVYYGDTPTRDILNAAVITVGDPNYSKIDALLKNNNNYVMYEYQRLWWPMQDYWNLNWNRVWYAISNPDMRQAIFDIWLNRDYTLYAKVTGETTLTLPTWQPAARMRVYIRKDIIAQMWDYGPAPTTAAPTTTTDPYAAGLLKLTPDLMTGTGGSGVGQFNYPRGLAVAPDGTIYVADSRNNRIVHLSADLKTVIKEWGTFADILKGAAPAGTFNEPWGVAVGPDGSVYVADTFNSRLEKFSADGTFIKMWGVFGQAETLDALWGPRGLAFDSKGRLFVTDTGNKRVVVFDTDGKGLFSFGTGGVEEGQLDEPVGIAIDKEGNVYIADTWNQRIQEFSPDASGTNYIPVRMWDVSAWSGQSLDNKPFLALDSAGDLYATDPEGGRVLIFSPDGKYLRGIGQSTEGQGNFVMPAGVAIDSEDHVYITDAILNEVMRFTMPALNSSAQPSSSPSEVLPSPTATSAGEIIGPAATNTP